MANGFFARVTFPCLKSENQFFVVFFMLLFEKRPKITELFIRTLVSPRKTIFKTKTDEDNAIISKNQKIYVLSRNFISGGFKDHEKSLFPCLGAMHFC